MADFSLTRSILTYAAGVASYADVTIKGSIQKGGSTFNFTGFSQTAKFARTLFTADILHEGDRVTDYKSVVYEVHFVDAIEYGDNFIGYQAELFELQTATLKTLTLGAADTTTGIYAVSYASSTIYANLAPRGYSTINTGLGYYGKYESTVVTSTHVLEGDIITVNAVDYEVVNAQVHPSKRADGFYWTTCYVVKRDFATQPATSGTWHVDSEAIKTDPRNRIKTVIDTYLVAANITKDDGVTNATTVTCFDGATYPIYRVFTTKTVDAVAVISRGASSVLYTDWVFGHKPYGFEEQVKIDIYAINKTTITASNLAEKYEQEIRRIFTVYDAYTNVRDIDTVAPSTIDLGYSYLTKTTITIKYKRTNDDYTPTVPSITWGPSSAATGTYILPNVTKLGFVDPDTGDIRVLPPGRVGDILQILGSEDFEVVLTCDLSLGSSKTWKRPQASTPKTDGVAWQVFNDIKFGGKIDSTKIYQTFNYGGGATIPIRLTSIEVDGETLTVHLKRYSSADQSAGTYAAYYGTS